MSYKINICKKFDVQKFSDSVVHVLYIKGFISDLLKIRMSVRMMKVPRDSEIHFADYSCVGEG